MSSALVPFGPYELCSFREPLREGESALRGDDCLLMKQCIR